VTEQGIRRQEIRLTDPEAVTRLLNRACAMVDDAQYAFITSRDGLVISAGTAAENPGDADEQVALRGSALGAAAAGIGDNFAALASHGRLQSALFESDRGCVGVFPVSSTLLLIVSSARSVNLGRLTAAAKKIIALLHAPDDS